MDAYFETPRGCKKPALKAMKTVLESKRLLCKLLELDVPDSTKYIICGITALVEVDDTDSLDDVFTA